MKAVIELTADPYEQVRYWATEGLGQTAELDTPDVRRLLQERRADESSSVRWAALDGLALRGDIEALAEALRDPDDGLIMAAERAAAPELDEPLLAAKARWKWDIEGLERAIAACRPEGPPTSRREGDAPP